MQSVKQTVSSTEKPTYFPVTDYIRGQLTEIEGLPITPLKIITSNGKQDSIWMKKENIRSFAEPFLHPQIDSLYLNRFYEEKSFVDETINSITITYDPKNDSAHFKSISVYITPQNNKVTRIYMVKESTESAGRQTLQLTWKTNLWCKITTITERAGSPPAIKEELMKWDFRD